MTNFVAVLIPLLLLTPAPRTAQADEGADWLATLNAGKHDQESGHHETALASFTRVWDQATHPRQKSQIAVLAARSAAVVGTRRQFDDWVLRAGDQLAQEERDRLESVFRGRTLVVPPAPPAPAVVAPPAAVKTIQRASWFTPRRTWGVALMGLSALSVAGSGLAVHYWSDARDRYRHCRYDGPNCMAIKADHNLAASLAIAGGVQGGISLGAAVALLLWPSAPSGVASRPITPRLTCSAGPGDVGISCAANF